MNPQLIAIILIIALFIMLKTGIYRPSRYWPLKRLDGKPTYCIKCSSPDTITTMPHAAFSSELRHECNKCGCVWNS